MRAEPLRVIRAIRQFKYSVAPVHRNPESAVYALTTAPEAASKRCTRRPSATS